MNIGKWICYEGADYCGKSTMANLTHDWLSSIGISSIVAPQPGSTPLGQRLREIVKHDKEIKLGKETEAMIFLLDHMAFVENVLVNSLNSGIWVLSDRHDYLSGLVYQVLNGVDPDRLQSFYSTIKSPMVDVLFILKISGENAGNRMKLRSPVKWDRYESNHDYVVRVQKSYDNFIDVNKRRIDEMTKYPMVIDANRSVEMVFDNIKKELSLLIQ